jgi:hypothetical protein
MYCLVFVLFGVAAGCQNIDLAVPAEEAPPGALFLIWNGLYAVLFNRTEISI